MEPITHRAFRRLRAQTTQLAVAQINSMNFPTLTLGVKRVAIGRIEQNIKTVATGKRGPIGIANQLFALHSARPDPVLVVLQTAGDSEIRFRIVETDPIKFSRRNFVQVVPILSAGKTLIETAIGPEQQPLTNRWFWRFVFVFRLWRLRRWRRAGLNCYRVAIWMHFLGKIFPEIFAAVI